jgi:predicted metalloendopeptidase
MDDWKTYLRWMTVNSAAPTLSKAFCRREFQFFRQIFERRERAAAALENLRRKRPTERSAKRSAGIRQTRLQTGSAKRE